MVGLEFVCPDVVDDEVGAVVFLEEYFESFCGLYVSNDGGDGI